MDGLPSASDLLRLLKGDAFNSDGAIVLLNRTFRIKGFGVAFFIHRRHTKKSRDSLGAARRRPGNNEAIEELNSRAELGGNVIIKNHDYVIQNLGLALEMPKWTLK